MTGGILWYEKGVRYHIALPQETIPSFRKGSKLKKIIATTLLLLFSVSILSACGGKEAPNTRPDAFPYTDLSEEAYVQNAKTAMDDMIAYLETAEGDDLDAVLNTYYDDVRKETTPETITSSEIIMAYEDYLLDASEESRASVQEMSEDELAAFREKSKADMEKQIPNALSLNDKRVERQKAGESTAVGTYNFKNQKILSFDEDGSLGVSTV